MSVIWTSRRPSVSAAHIAFQLRPIHSPRPVHTPSHSGATPAAALSTHAPLHPLHVPSHQLAIRSYTACLDLLLSSGATPAAGAAAVPAAQIQPVRSGAKPEVALRLASTCRGRSMRGASALIARSVVRVRQGVIWHGTVLAVVGSLHYITHAPPQAPLAFLRAAALYALGRYGEAEV